MTTTPGYKTSEFWLKILAFVLTALYASGIVPTSGALAQALAIGATILGALGYTVARTMLKATAPRYVEPKDTAPRNSESGRVSLTLLALIGLLAVIGCSALSCTAAQKKSLSDFGKCEETAAVKLLEPAVRTVGEDYLAYAACVATGGSDCHGLTKDDAFKLLDSFATSYGLATVQCATTLAAQFFASKASGSADTQSAVDMYNEWLQTHGAK